MNINKIEEPYVILLIGPPLSGKTTWINKNFIDKSVNVISRDQIVLDEYGSDDYDKSFKNVDQKKVNQILEESMENAAYNMENVIVDMTNLTSKRRKHTLSHFGDDYTKIAVIFPLIEWDEFISRNEKRKREENKTIPEHVIKRMISSYQAIRDDEGFDKVVSI